MAQGNILLWQQALLLGSLGAIAIVSVLAGFDDPSVKVEVPLLPATDCLTYPAPPETVPSPVPCTTNPISDWRPLLVECVTLGVSLVPDADLYPATPSALVIVSSRASVKLLFTVYVPVLLQVAASITISPLPLASAAVVIGAPVVVPLPAVAPIGVVWLTPERNTLAYAELVGVALQVGLKVELVAAAIPDSPR
jgi:hypothetical protein